MFYQKLFWTKFLGLIETKNFANFRFFRISQIILKKCNFEYSIVFFLN